MTSHRFKLPIIGEYPRRMLLWQLPTNKDVLLHYMDSKLGKPRNMRFNDLKDAMVNEITSLYRKVPQAMMELRNVELKLKNYLEDYEEAKKRPTGNKALAFQQTLNRLFDISACKCEPIQPSFFNGELICPCLPEHCVLETEYPFMVDQRDPQSRRLFIDPKVDDVLTDFYANREVRRTERQTREAEALRLAQETKKSSATTSTSTPANLQRTRQKQYDLTGT